MESTDAAATSYTWVPPLYDISRIPVEKASYMPSIDPENPENFVRSSRWSPDGTVFLAQCENRTFQIFDAPSDEVSEEVYAETFNKPLRTFSQPAPILDFQWFPTASKHDPATFCFAASVRECPVKLLDAQDGRLRASYRIVDHRERQVAPHCLAFNLTGDKLYCGFEDAIEVFDVSRPGEGLRLHTTPSKKSKDGLKGIVSALAFSPYYDSETLYAAGTLSPTLSNIGLFNGEGEAPVMFIGGGPRAGVTQLHFNPCQPHILYAAYRGSGAGMVYSWDIRANVDEPLQIYDASSTDSPRSTQESRNQKRRFDVDLAGRYLGVGNHAGEICFFRLETSENPTLSTGYDETMTESDCVQMPVLRFPAHRDAVGSVSFHPWKPLALSACGSRHFVDPNDSSSSEEDVFPDTPVTPNVDGTSQAPVIRKRLRPVTLDSSVKVWDLQSPTLQ